MKTTKVSRRRRDARVEELHLESLRALAGERRRHDDVAFLRGPRSAEALAEQLGEEFIAGATGSVDEGQDLRDQLVEEELGGPFIETSARTELARGFDASNPRGSKREPFPTT